MENINIKVKDFSKEIFNKLSKENKYSKEISYFFSQRKKLYSCLDFEPDNNFIPNAPEMAKVIENIILTEPESLILYTDYDNDGFTGGFIFLDFIKEKYGKKIDFHINDRITEGYGINGEVIEEISKKGYKYIITVDLGISNIEQIEKAKNLGLKVYITDHHLPRLDDNLNEIYPPADLIVNTNIEINNGFERGVSGAFTIWHVLSFIDKELANKYVDLVGLSLLSDNMPLDAPLVNYYVKKSIEQFNEKKYSSKFVGELVEKHKEAKKRVLIDEMDLGFYVIPLINAVGRLGQVKQLMKYAVDEDLNKYEWIREINEERKTLTTEFSEKAIKTATELYNNGNRILLVVVNHCPEGIVGLIASRICEKFKLPSIVATLDETGERYKASGRSKENFDFKDFFSDPEIKYVITQEKEYDDEDEEERKLKILEKRIKKGLEDNKLIQGGGHKYACGMSFKKKFLDIVQSRLKVINQPTNYTIEVEGILSFEREKEKIEKHLFKKGQIPHPSNLKLLTQNSIKNKFSVNFVEDMKKHLYPFGQCNPEPQFLLKENIEEIKLLGAEGKHIKFDILNFSAIAFNVTNDIIEDYRDYYCIGNFSINEFRDKKSVQFMIKDFIHKDKINIIE